MLKHCRENEIQWENIFKIIKDQIYGQEIPFHPNVILSHEKARRKYRKLYYLLPLSPFTPPSTYTHTWFCYQQKFTTFFFIFFCLKKGKRGKKAKKRKTFMSWNYESDLFYCSMLLTWYSQPKNPIIANLPILTSTHINLPIIIIFASPPSSFSRVSIRLRSERMRKRKKKMKFMIFTIEEALFNSKMRERELVFKSSSSSYNLNDIKWVEMKRQQQDVIKWKFQWNEE